MTPSAAGAMAGLLAGAASLAFVHRFHPLAIVRPVLAAAAARGVTPILSFAIAYATAIGAGGLLGATFSVITRSLRRWLPLLVWSVVVFGALTMLGLATSRTYGGGRLVALEPVLLQASAIYAFVFSFSLPIRRRR